MVGFDKENTWEYLAKIRDAAEAATCHHDVGSLAIFV